MILGPLFLLVSTLVMTIISISIFNMLPGFFKKLCALVPPLGFLLNLAASSFILMFTGVAMIVGVSNLIASVFFAAYLLLYRSAHGINRVELKWNGPWKIKLFPSLRIIEARPSLSGFQKVIF